MFKQVLVFLLAAAALAGCDVPPGADSVPSPAALVAPAPPTDPQTQMAPLEDRIAQLIEEQREKLDPGAKKLVLDPELQRVARERATDMAQKNYLAHAAPNGDTSASLLMAEDQKWQGLLGENLAAQHYRKESGIDVAQFAQRFLDTWMNSQPHRENLSFADYDRTGVGAAVNGDTVYVAQLFSTDMGLPPLKDGAPSGTVTPFGSPAAARADGIAGQPPAPVRLRGAQ
jgi:uncharacterized protein YkwD